jgi:RimJ/RimL family protein N-acetyltransferase
MDDYAAFCAYKADPEVTHFVGGTELGMSAWKSFCATVGSWSMIGHGVFCVAIRETDECIGHCGPINPPGWPEPEIGYTLARGAHGKGYATEAAGAALRFAYQKLGWRTAISLIDEDNTASQGVARRLGASLEKKQVEVCDFTADIWRHLPPEEILKSNPTTF